MMYKRCTKCLVEKPLTEFHMQGSNKTRRPDCRSCRKRPSDIAPSDFYPESRKDCTCPICGVAIRCEVNTCAPCMHQMRRDSPPKWRKNHHGYIVAGKRDLSLAQHRLVMESVLGRPLLPGENVHHRNGIRHDNRPEKSGIVGNHSTIWTKT